MSWLLWVTVISFWFCVFVVWVLPWLRCQEWAQGFFKKIEPIEIKLWKKSETILFARFQHFLGFLLSAIGFLGGIDYTPFAVFLPQKYHALLPAIPSILNVIGTFVEAMRNRTTKPVELVQIPTKVLERRPDVAAVVNDFEAAKIEAVATVKEKGIV